MRYSNLWKWTRWPMTSVFVLVILLISIHVYIIQSTQSRLLTIDEAIAKQADCILVLGAGVWRDNRPSPMLADRLLQGILLYNQGASKRLLMSGDHGTPTYDEVNVMKQFAIEAGVPSKHIFMDHAGFSTYESMYRARDIFLAKRIIIVTQHYHMARALYVADKLGLDAYGVTADPRRYAGQTYRDLRETIARLKDFCYVMIQPKPTYLGDTIPLTGDGDITNDK